MNRGVGSASICATRLKAKHFSELGGRAIGALKLLSQQRGVFHEFSPRLDVFDCWSQYLQGFPYLSGIELGPRQIGDHITIDPLLRHVASRRE